MMVPKPEVFFQESCINTSMYEQKCLNHGLKMVNDWIKRNQTSHSLHSSLPLGESWVHYTGRRKRQKPNNHVLDKIKTKHEGQAPFVFSKKKERNPVAFHVLNYTGDLYVTR